MEKEKVSLLNPQIPVYASDSKYAPLSSASKRAPLCVRLSVLFVGFCLSYSVCEWLWGAPYSPTICMLPIASNYDNQTVNWKSCGEGIKGYECADITVPLDYHNANDTRTTTIAVTRFPATDRANRQGAIFLNPGGPGGSGTNHIYRRSNTLSTIVKGQFDLIGFDPRGINLTRPYVSCFENEMEAEVFKLSVNGFNLNLPSNVSSFMPGVEQDLQRQIEYYTAAWTSLARKCRERTGEEIGYMGTEAVVRDIDILSRIIEGEDKPVNFWGFSYGTVIGQYLIKILPPERIGRVIIDGVVNPTVWADYPTLAHREGLDNVDDVLESFASSCHKASSNCTLNSFKPNSVLNFTSPGALLSAIDITLDNLYTKPAPVFDLPVPAVATASSIRSLLFNAMYSIAKWPELAEHLAAAFNGNYTGIVNATMEKVDAANVKKPDSSIFSTSAIFCADAKPYDDKVSAPSSAEFAKLMLESLDIYSKRMGDRFYILSTCHAWDPAGLNPRKSRYAGTFEMEDDVLHTPMLILSNTFDPSTSLAAARYANDRLGNNARLIQQRDGWGHCSLSQISYCTARAVRAYMVYGRPPSEKHMMCEVDQLPWQPFEDKIIVEDIEEGELRKAWRELAEDWARD